MTRRFVLAFAALLGALPFRASAQDGAAPVRPEYQILRFNENWSVLRGAAPSDWADPLKYVPLSEGGAVYLSVGGQLRFRGEAVQNFQLGTSPDRDDGFGLTRALLHADLHATPHLRVFVEGKHALAHGRELPGGARPLDEDRWELQNAFADVAFGGRSGAAAGIRVGRQEILLGSQRLVSPLDWSNTRRTFQGARGWVELPAAVVDGFWTRPVVIRSRDPNHWDEQTAFWGATLRSRSAAPRPAWELYLLGLNQGDSTRLSGFTGSHDRATLGGRGSRTVLSAANRIEVEGGWQTGKLAGRSISAFFVASDLTRTFARLPTRPTAGVGLDYASGDGDPGDDRIGTFHQLYPLSHAYAGYMDLLGRQNLVEARAVVTSAPTPRSQLRGSLHHFLRARSTDAAYNAAGAVFRAPAGERSRALGTELDLTGNHRLGRHTRLEAGYGHFFPGAFLERTTGGAAGSDWGYLSAAVTF